MNLADKRVYPIDGTHLSQGFNEDFGGITYKEALVLALAGNSNIVIKYNLGGLRFAGNAMDIIKQADAIIKELEK